MNYTIKWTQTYPNWLNPLDKYVEDMLQFSNFKEALEVISRIKTKLKD